MKVKNFLKAGYFSVVAFLLNINLAFAITSEDSIKPLASELNLNGVIQNIKLFTLYVGGVIVLIMFIVAGIIYMTAGGNEKKVEAAKLALQSAVIGVAIILGVFLLVTLVSTILTGGLPTG